MASHSSIPAWRISRTKEPDGLQPMGSQRIGHDSKANPLNFETYMRRQKTCTLKTIRYRLKKLKMTTDRKIYCVLGLKKISSIKMTLPVWESRDSMQLLSNYQWHFSQNQNKNLKIFMETQRTLNCYSNLEKKNEAEGLRFPAFR